MDGFQFQEFSNEQSWCIECQDASERYLMNIQGNVGLGIVLVVIGLVIAAVLAPSIIGIAIALVGLLLVLLGVFGGAAGTRRR